MKNYEYFVENLPEHLSRILFPLENSIKLQFDGHSNGINVFFSVRSMEKEEFEVLGFFYETEKENYFLSPIYIKDILSKKCCLLINTNIHGYNGSQGDSSTLTGLGKPENYRCTKCENDRFRLFVRLEYPEDILDEGATISGFEGRESELFSWFTLINECTLCNQTKISADFECA